MRKSAAGITEKPELHGPRDELDLVVMNLLADPAVMDGKGSANLRVLTDDQRRARNRARMNEQAAEARCHLDKVLKGDDEDESSFDLDTYQGVSLEEAERIINRDDEGDPLEDLWADPWYAEGTEES